MWGCCWLLGYFIGVCSTPVWHSLVFISISVCMTIDISPLITSIVLLVTHLAAPVLCLIVKHYSTSYLTSKYHTSSSSHSLYIQKSKLPLYNHEIRERQLLVLKIEYVCSDFRLNSITLSYTNSYVYKTEALWHQNLTISPTFFLELTYKI